MRFQCDRCGKRYSTKQVLVEGRTYTFKCLSCGHKIALRKAAPSAEDFEPGELPRSEPDITAAATSPGESLTWPEPSPTRPSEPAKPPAFLDLPPLDLDVEEPRAAVEVVRELPPDPAPTPTPPPVAARPPAPRATARAARADHDDHAEAGDRAAPREGTPPADTWSRPDASPSSGRSRSRNRPPLAIGIAAGVAVGGVIGIAYKFMGASPEPVAVAVAPRPATPRPATPHVPPAPATPAPARPPSPEPTPPAVARVDPPRDPSPSTPDEPRRLPPVTRAEPTPSPRAAPPPRKQPGPPARAAQSRAPSPPRPSPAVSPPAPRPRDPLPVAVARSIEPAPEPPREVEAAPPPRSPPPTPTPTSQPSPPPLRLAFAVPSPRPAAAAPVPAPMPVVVPTPSRAADVAPDEARGDGLRVLLRRDVDGLGRSGEAVEVPPGYARTFLLPRGLAVLAPAHGGDGPRPGAVPAEEEEPAAPGAGYRRPEQATPRCVERALRVPADGAGRAGGTLKVKFAVGRTGVADLIQVQPGPDWTGGAPLEPRLVEAVSSAVRGCQFTPGADEQGRPARLWVTMQLRVGG